MLHNNPVAALGQASLLLSLVAAAYTIAVSIAGARRGSRKLVRSGIYGAYGSTALVTFSSAIMFFLLLSNDYSVKYVQRHSDASMPWFYKLTSFWGGLDGSIMWWALLLALFSSVAIFVNQERHRELIPWVTAILFSVVGFFLLLIIFEKRPFDVFLIDSPKVGRGLNPLLQNPYMATHPPSLYLGFVSATVPFAFGLAALITGNLDDSWIQSTRRWVIVSWYFLSQGLVLGCLWAYEELGWGGYWGWDPVENAGFLPWLTSTAFLHSIMIQERRGMLKVWNVCLVITTFLLTIIGTFMTRSGIVQSVHAFGQDTELAIIFGSYIVAVAVFSFGLVIYRLPLLRSRNELDSWVSREFAFLVNNWILLSAAFFVLIATLFPTISEWVTGERITVGPPFFTRWMAPIGLILLFLTGVGPLIAWRKASIENLRLQFTWPTVVGVATAIVCAFIPPLRAMSSVFNERIQLPLSIICFALCAFTLTTITQEFVRGARVRQLHTKLDFFTSLVGLVSRNKKRYGGYFVHAAVVLMFLGFAGGAYKQETEATLERGQSTKLGGYTVRFDGLERSNDPGKEITSAAITVMKGGQELARMHPAKYVYKHHEEEPTTEVEIRRMPKEDLYLVLNGYDGEAMIANLKVVINPLVNWIWIGFLFLAIGTIVAFMPDRGLVVAAQKAKENASKAGASTLVLLFVLGLGAVAHAADAPEAPTHGARMQGVYYARNDRESKLFQKIVCQCGTCGRQVLSECACGTAHAMRHKIQQLIDGGASDEQVIDYELQTYPGQSALVVPLDKGFNRVAWLLPISALLFAAGGLVVMARKWTYAARIARERGASAPAVASTGAAAQPTGPRDEYEDKLDDELDELD
jgi:cytochrome c-type biogenesis protein CcmF